MFLLLLVSTMLQVVTIGEGCRNKHDSTLCNKWAELGECTANVDWMIPNCALSCGACAKRCRNSMGEDNPKICFQLAKSGGCVNNQYEMARKCSRACNVCDSVCKNKETDEVCDWKARNGDCITDIHTMTRDCALSCHACHVIQFFDNVQYTFHRHALNWFEASQHCKYHGDSLALPEDMARNDWLGEMARKYFVGEVWLGSITQQGKYVDTKMKPLGFNDWDEGYPKDTELEQLCVYMDRITKHWKSDECLETRRQFICRRSVTQCIDEITDCEDHISNCLTSNTVRMSCRNSCDLCDIRFNQGSFEYLIVKSTLKTFEEAQLTCNNSKGALATPEDGLENTVIGQMIRSTGGTNTFWIGLHDKELASSYERPDGRKFYFPLYHTDEVDSTTRDCVSMSRQSMKWVDDKCELKKSFVCKTSVDNDEPKPTEDCSTATCDEPYGLLTIKRLDTVGVCLETVISCQGNKKLENCPNNTGILRLQERAKWLPWTMNCTASCKPSETYGSGYGRGYGARECSAEGHCLGCRLYTYTCHRQDCLDKVKGGPRKGTDISSKEKKMAIWTSWKKTCESKCGKSEGVNTRKCVSGKCVGCLTNHTKCILSPCNPGVGASDSSGPGEVSSNAWGEWSDRCSCGKDIVHRIRLCTELPCLGCCTEYLQCNKDSCSSEVVSKGFSIWIVISGAFVLGIVAFSYISLRSSRKDNRASLSGSMMSTAADSGGNTGEPDSLPDDLSHDHALQDSTAITAMDGKDAAQDQSHEDL